MLTRQHYLEQDPKLKCYSKKKKDNVIKNRLDPLTEHVEMQIDYIFKTNALFE